MIRPTRLGAAALGVALLAWQVVNAARGRFVHAFLVPDLVLGVGLLGSALIRRDRPAAAALLAMFAATLGVFLSATSARLLLGGYDLGTALTSLGLVPCLAACVVLGRWLAR